MGFIRRITAWIAISVFLQIAVLAYFNYIYLSGRSSRTIATLMQWDDFLVNRTIHIPARAGEIKVSASTRYAAFIDNKRLKVIDTLDKKEKSIDELNNLPVGYFRWLPDRNMIIYSSVYTSGEKAGISVATYDFDTGIGSRYPGITGLDRDSRVVDIQLSPVTNTVYVTVQAGESKARIYRYNIMDELAYIMDIDINTPIRQPMYTDRIIYCEGNKLLSRDGENGEIESLTFQKPVEILGIGEEDSLYLGEINEKGQISNIYYGTIEEYFQHNTKEIAVKKPIRREDIIEAAGREIYIIDLKEGVLVSLKNEKRLVFDGDIIEILEDYIITRNHDKLKITVLKHQ